MTQDVASWLRGLADHLESKPDARRYVVVGIVNSADEATDFAAYEHGCIVADDETANGLAVLGFLNHFATMLPQRL